MADEQLRPILVIGLMQRVGTNYLGRLLQAHPDCTAPKRLHEDFLLSGFSHLENFVRSVSAGWNPEWGARESVPELRRRLGAAVAEFARADAEDANKRPVLKSPTRVGLEFAPAYLPQCDIVVLVRHGPDVVESGMSTFGWEFDDACRRWGRAARKVAELRDKAPRAFALVKYEDLVSAPEPTLRNVFEFTGLDAERFDYAAAAESPVYGSSAARGDAEQVHWAPVKKPADFDPLARSRHWSEEQLRRFDELSEGAWQRLGYTLARQSSRGPS